MGKRPSCSKDGFNKGAWTAIEDKVLKEYIQTHGEGKWGDLAQRAGLKRCGKSCRLRWLNYLRPGIKRGSISEEEEDLIIRLHKLLGNRWALIAGRLPGRTDNEIKNYWHTKLKKLKTKPQTCTATTESSPDYSSNYGHPNQIVAVEKPNLATKHHLYEPRLDPNQNDFGKSSVSCAVGAMATSYTNPVIMTPRPTHDHEFDQTLGLPSSLMNSKENDDQLSDFMNLMDFENTDWITELPY